MFSLIKIRGYSTRSKETIHIMMSVFILQFLNTGPFILIANGDFSELEVPIISDYLNLGIHRDFTAKWYEDVGKQITYAMLLYIGWPIFFEFCFWHFLRMMRRAIDKSCYMCGSEPTKSKVIQDYIDLYSGPEYLIHYKYSFVLNVIFTTFMFGAGMPILFPIAFFTLCVVFIMDKLLLAKYYRQPAMLDDTLNCLAIRVMMLAPILYCAIGFWMYNNAQIFKNKEIEYASTYGEHLRTGHNFWETIDHAKKNFHSGPYFVGLCLMVLLRLIQSLWFRWSSDKLDLKRLGSQRSEKTKLFDIIQKT